MRAGGLTLGRAAQYLCPGVVLAVVDPGVGTERRAVAIEVGDGQSYLVGPDNGLLAAAVAMSGGRHRGRRADQPRLPAPGPGPDLRRARRVRPAAAHLCNGRAPRRARRRRRPALAAPRPAAPDPREEDGALVAEVLWVDRFGNCQLNVDPDEIGRLGARVQLRWGDDVRTARRAAHLSRASPPGQVGLVIDSYGMLVGLHGQALRRRRARPCRVGTEVTLVEPVDDEATRADSASPSPSPRGATDEARHHHRPRHPARPDHRRRLQLFILA